MANLSIRRLDQGTLERLRVRAAQHGVSMEEEARRILADAVAPPQHLGDMAMRLFGAGNGVELEHTPDKAHEPTRFRP